jgi:hypothetical protein
MLEENDGIIFTTQIIFLKKAIYSFHALFMFIFLPQKFQDLKRYPEASIKEKFEGLCFTNLL